MKKRILAFLVIIALCIGCMPAYAQASSADPVEAFVERLYANILQRDADSEGIKLMDKRVENGCRIRGRKWLKGLWTVMNLSQEI